MAAINAFAAKRPLAFVLLTLLFWLLVSGMLAAASGALLDLPVIDAVPQMIGSLGATLVLLAIAGWLGWLPSIGILSLGGWRLWLITIPLLAYLLAAYLYGFFGDLSFEFGIFARSETARGLLLRQGIVGFVEETVFRGIILYALVRAWGRSKRGLLLSVLVQAALFAAPHLLQAGAGISWTQVLMVIVNGFVSGIWWGVLVLLGGSLWSVVLLHGLSNLSVQVRSLSSASIEPALAAYGRATLLELPLALLAIWLLLRAPLGSESDTES
jgi:membrane protease YdiL (CAAX protease family)